MINIQLGDLTRVKDVEYICNAANGVGPMGRGIAGAIHRAGGKSIQDEAFIKCRKNDPQPGEYYTTRAGTLPYKGVIHLVTMKQPGGPTSLLVVEKCLKNLIKYCQIMNINKVALPALATGIGGLNKIDVAKIYKDLLTDIDIEFLVVDIDKEFINQF